MNYLVLFSGAMSTFFYLVVRCETHDLYVYVCIYIYIYVYIFIYMYIYICIYTYTYTHYIYIHIYIFKLLEFSSCAMSSCFHLVVQWETYNFYACIYLYICVCIHIYIYTYIYYWYFYSGAMSTFFFLVVRWETYKFDASAWENGIATKMEGTLMTTIHSSSG